MLLYYVCVHWFCYVCYKLLTCMGIRWHFNLKCMLDDLLKINMCICSCICIDQGSVLSGLELSHWQSSYFYMYEIIHCFDDGINQFNTHAYFSICVICKNNVKCKIDAKQNKKRYALIRISSVATFLILSHYTKAFTFTSAICRYALCLIVIFTNLPCKTLLQSNI